MEPLAYAYILVSPLKNGVQEFQVRYSGAWKGVFVHKQNDPPTIKYYNYIEKFFAPSILSLTLEIIA